VKGVTYIRVKLHPVAECQHCGWTFGRGAPAVTVRANAERHVVDKSHIVTVTTKDITEYAPDGREAAKEQQA
jgi:hypothetical protein